jgi:CubicO group peptidase (beta-lactamase class C family)
MVMVGRRGFLGAAAVGLVGGWAGIVSGQEPSGTGSGSPATAGAGARGTTRRKVLRPVLPMEPLPPVRADETLNKRLSAVVERHNLPGMIAALVRGGTIAAIGAAGVRKLGSEEPMRIGDRVHIGSCTKAMTGTMIGTLVDEGALSWSSTVAAIFPDLAEVVHPDYRDVTLLQLLNHRAGLPHDVDWARQGRGRGLSQTQQRRRLLEQQLKEAPGSKPGTTFAYSNAGYMLAGLMAEQVTGQPWEALMRARLFEPLGMSSAGFGPPGAPGQLNEPWGHREEEGKVVPHQRDNPPTLGPAGTVHVSIPDWAKFALLHLRGDRGDALLLDPDTFRVLHTPPAGSPYAGGWGVYTRFGDRRHVLVHDGSNTQWYAVIRVATPRNLILLAATNLGGDAAEKACHEVVEELMGPGPA